MFAEQKLRGKDILLLHVPMVLDCRKDSLNFYATLMPMGFNSIGGELMRKDYEIEIINFGVEKTLNFDFSIADYVKDHGFKIVGLSLHWYVQSYSVIEIAKEIKQKNPDVLIVFGGYTASIFPEEIMKKCSFIDMIIKGEGEIPFAQLADIAFKNEKDFSHVPNLYWRKQDKIIVNKNKWVASLQELNNFNFIEALSKIRNMEMALRTSISLVCYNGESNFLPHKLICHCLGRGCSGNCVWCGGGACAQLKITGRNNVLQRNSEIIFRELLEIKNRFGITTFYFGQDLDPLNQTEFTKLLNLINMSVSKEFSFQYECFGLPTKEFIDLYASSLKLDSCLTVSPDFFDEDLREKYKSFSYSNKALYDTLHYMREKNLNGLIYLATLQNMPNIEKTNQELMKWGIEKENGIGNGHIQVQSLEVKDVEPYSPWYLDSEKYGIENIKRDFVFYYELLKQACVK